MPSTPLDMAQMTVSGTPGTGPITLGSATTGYQSFSAAGAVTGNIISYNATDPSGVWEVGTSPYTASGPTLSARTVRAGSSGAGTPVSLTSNAIITATFLDVDILRPSPGGRPYPFP